VVGHAGAAITVDRCADVFNNDPGAEAGRLDVVRESARGRSSTAVYGHRVAHLLPTTTPRAEVAWPAPSDTSEHFGAGLEVADEWGDHRLRATSWPSATVRRQLDRCLLLCVRVAVGDPQREALRGLRRAS